MTATGSRAPITHAALTSCGLAALVSCGAPAPPARPAADAVGPGTLLEGRTEGGEVQHFRIDAVAADPRDRDGDVSLYSVSILVGDAQWRPYCLPDAEGRRAVIPVQGSWGADGVPQPASDLVTFACTSGAIGKCIRFGYKPWKQHRGVALSRYHAACIRMVRADYCGDDRPHTVDGTQIDIWDSLGIQSRDERTGHPELFEAAWSPGGAAYLNVPRWSDDVADVIADCPEHFRGRTSRDGALLPSEVAQHFPEVLIFDARFVRSEDRRPARK
jgi:hypothetical protein